MRKRSTGQIAEGAQGDPDPENRTSGTRENSAKSPTPSWRCCPCENITRPNKSPRPYAKRRLASPSSRSFEKLDIHENPFCTRKRRFGGLGTPEIRELRQLREENTKLKQRVADLILDRKLLQDILSQAM